MVVSRGTLAWLKSAHSTPCAPAAPDVSAAGWTAAPCPPERPA